MQVIGSKPVVNNVIHGRYDSFRSQSNLLPYCTVAVAVGTADMVVNRMCKMPERRHSAVMEAGFFGVRESDRRGGWLAPRSRLHGKSHLEIKPGSIQRASGLNSTDRLVCTEV